MCHSNDLSDLSTTHYILFIQEPLLNTLIEVQTFLAANPSEIVTIIFEDYVTAPNGLTNVFKAANLTQYWFPAASMPVNGAAWPTIGTLIQNNWRLVVFTSKRAKQATEGIAYQWAYMNENQCKQRCFEWKSGIDFQAHSIRECCIKC